jgi:hypothetical protein
MVLQSNNLGEGSWYKTGGGGVHIFNNGQLSTASTSFVDISSTLFSRTVTLGPNTTGEILVGANVAVSYNTSGGAVHVDISVNGVRITSSSDGIGRTANNGDIRLLSVNTLLTGYSPGVYVIRLMWRLGGNFLGSVILNSDTYSHSFFAKEL